MRAKRIARRGRSTAPADDPIPIDLGATAGQIGLFESANGIPHGPVAIAVALIVALSLVPIRAAWRALTDRRDR